MMSGAEGAPRAGSALKDRLPRLISIWREWTGEQTGAAPGSRAAKDRARALSRSEIESVGAALLRLQRGLTGKREFAGAPYMEDAGLLGAYLLYYWPVSYLQTSLAMAELGSRPRRVLDLGSGPGPAAAAALDSGSSCVDLADSSGKALELASRVLARDADRIAVSRVDLESPDALAPASGPYDLIIVGHCLNELWRAREDRLARRGDLLSRAARLLAPGGILLAIEPALLETSREALALRDALAAAGHPILGPCPASSGGPYPCPALAAGPDRTCHAEASWDPPEPVASLASEAGLDRRSVKYAWFAAAPPGAAPPGEAAAPAAPRPPAFEAPRAGGPAAEVATSIEGRVVSDPMLNKAGRVRYFVCSEGRIATLSAAASSAEARSSGFLSLRRGDRLRVLGAERRQGGGLGLVASSSLTLLARAPEVGR
jgi:SAM-dependent methyltransferase